MVNLQVNQIKKHLELNYVPYVDDSDLKELNETEKENHVLSRAYAAYAVVSLGGYEPQDVCVSITDEFGDNGIDLIHIDTTSKKIWIVQSKFSMSGEKGVDCGDIHKFIQGLRELCDGNYRNFGNKTKRLQTIIDDALCDAQYQIFFVIAYTRKDLSRENMDIINPYISEFNEGGEVLYFMNFNLPKAHEILKKGLNKPIECMLHIKNWGQTTAPYKSYYGIVDATEIAQLWGTYSTNLLSKNIRHFLGNTEANIAMIETLRNSPELFKYFNNGISILCSSIKKTLLGGTNTDVGLFECKDIQIVNGAQTVGTLGEFYKSPIEGAPVAEVFVKVISLEGAPEDFSIRQTIANNTQNKVEKKDFASLSPIQVRLKDELRLDGITYHLKRGVDVPTLDEYNYTFDEAATILAASQTDISLSVLAKREVGKLWESLTTPPYTLLFNDELTPVKLKHVLMINRAIKNELDSLNVSQTEPRNKRILVLGNLFIAHLVMQEVKREDLENKSLKIKEYIDNTIKPLVRKYAEDTIKTVNSNYANSNIPQLFRNYTKCRDIKSKIVNAEPESNIPNSEDVAEGADESIVNE